MTGFLRRLLPGVFGPPPPVVPVLRLSGMIGVSSPFRPGLTLEGLAGPIRSAFAVRDAPAVALLINSPGGAPVQSHLIYRRIRALAEEKGRKVLAYIEDVGASGGYMLALAADEIIADPASMVGSIGVVSGTFGFDRLMERIGVERRIYTAGESKAMLDPFRPEDPKDVERIKALQASIHALFIDMVKERRGVRLADDPDLFTGAFWTGDKAKALGLVDALGDIRTDLVARYGEKVQLKAVQLQRGLFRRRSQHVTVGLAAAGVDAIIAAVEERALWSRFGL